MTTTYADFLAAKKARLVMAGRPGCHLDDLPVWLSPFQKDLTLFTVHRGRAALWADTGLGKTRMQLAWANEMMRAEVARDSKALILAPLAVASQTIREAAELGLKVDYVRDQDDVERSPADIVITNYDRLHKIKPEVFAAVVLDESSVLKDVTTKTRDRLIEAFESTPFRLACTATPAPNDVTELANHAEFLGVATRQEMLSTYFIADTSRGYRVKHHGEQAMWDWVATWAIAARRPSDLGYDDGGYDLPPLTIIPHLLPVNSAPDEALFATELGGVGGRAKIRRETLHARVRWTAELVDRERSEPWLLWCGLNAEADALARVIPGSVNVDGAMPSDDKRDALLDFADGRTRVLITKPSIAGKGLNWQHCARMAFVGLGDSYEDYYQAIRRCYRYGQTKPVHAHLVLSEIEGQIADNIARKESQARTAQDQLIARMRAHQEAS